MKLSLISSIFLLALILPEKGDAAFSPRLSAWLEQNQISLRQVPSHDETVKTLNFAGKAIEELPGDVVQELAQAFPQVEILYLSFNHLRTLPKEIENFQKLKVLDLHSNQFGQRSLWSLVVGRPKGGGLPDALGNLPHLVSLNLSQNQLEDLPQGLKKARNLETLNLSQNQLSEFPPEVLGMENLVVLKVEDNSLTHLPEELSHLIFLRQFAFRGNSLGILPAELRDLFHRLDILWLNSYRFPQFDLHGFDRESGLHQITGTPFNPEGWDRDGFDLYGYDRHKFHRDTQTYFNLRGFDREGKRRVGEKDEDFRLEKEVEEAFRKAARDLAEKLSRDVVLLSDNKEMKFSLVQDFQKARKQAHREQLRKAPGTLMVNPEFLGMDPFHSQHNHSVHKIFPRDISDEECVAIYKLVIKSMDDHALAEGLSAWQNIPRELWAEARKNLRKIFQLAMGGQGSQTLRKRMLRILREGHDPSLNASKNLALRGLALYQNAGRCGDGLSQGLTQMEKDILCGPHEVPEGSTPVAKLGIKISKILTKAKGDFIEKHASLNPLSSEFQTTIVEVLGQRMLYPLSLNGEERAVLYPQLAMPQFPPFLPEKVMERFLQGGQVESCGGNPVTFEAYDAAKMVTLLRSAFEAKVISPMELQDLVMQEGKLREIYLNLVEDPELKNDYFEFGPGSMVYKEKFYEWLLQKYGYLNIKGSKISENPSGTPGMMDLLW